MTQLMDEIGMMCLNGQASSLPTDEVIESYNEFKELDLRGLGLSIWPSCVFKLKLLNGLFLSDNRLDGIPDGIKKLKKLRFLYMSKNHYQTVPRVLASLPSLSMVDMTDNRFIDRRGEIDWIKDQMVAPEVTQLSVGLNIKNTQPARVWSEITFRV